MQHNDRVLSMVKSAVMLAQTLGVTTIAECVEDARTTEILRDMGGWIGAKATILGTLSLQK